MLQSLIRKELPAIDETQTQKAIEDCLDRALLYKLVDYDRREATITASYEERMHTGSTGITDQTATVALHNVQQEQIRVRHIERVERAVSKLKRLQQQIIKERYLTIIGVTDTEVYLEILAIDKKTYYRHRNEALYTLAFFLGVYVKRSDAVGQ